MERAQVRERLNGIFRDIFDDDSLELNEAMTAAEVAGWDSLSHIDLIVAVEKEFKIKLTTAEIRGLGNAGDFVSVIARKAA
jgi:acyl carrier protein